jgi:protein O-mannosyl-transferase
MHVESVAWITERKDVLSTPLLFAAIAAYVRYTRAPTKNRRVLWYAGMLFCFALSLTAKSMGLTLPAVLLLLDYWPLRRMVAGSTRRLFWEKLPLILICLVVVVVAAHAQQIAGAASSLTTLTVVDRVENAILAYVIYVIKLLAPQNLAVFYPHPQSIAFSQAAAAAILLALITAASFRFRKSRPYLWVGWLWFIGTLVPVIGLVQIGAQAYADRYSYFPSVGLFIAIVWGISDLSMAWITTPRWRETIVGIGAAAAVATMAVLAHQQVEYWKDTRTLFTHALAVTDDSWVAHLELGNVAFEDGDSTLAQNEFLEVLRLQPRNPKAYNNLAQCIVCQSPADAIPLYEKAVEYDPVAPEYHVNLAAALSMTGEREAAISQLQQALKIQPDFQPALAGLSDLSHLQPAQGRR